MRPVKQDNNSRNSIINVVPLLMLSCDFHHCKKGEQKTPKPNSNAFWIAGLHVENQRFKKMAKNRNCAMHLGWTEAQLYSASLDTSDKWITIKAELWFTKFCIHNIDILMGLYQSLVRKEKVSTRAATWRDARDSLQFLLHHRLLISNAYF